MHFNFPILDHLTEEDKYLFLKKLVRHSFENHKIGFWQRGLDDLWKAKFEHVDFMYSFDAFRGGPIPLIKYYNKKENKDYIEILIRQKDWPEDKDTPLNVTLIFQEAIQKIKETRSYNQADATPKQLFQKFIFEDWERGFPITLNILHEVEYQKLQKRVESVNRIITDAL